MRRLKTVRRPPIYPNGAQAISPVAPSPLFRCPHAVHRCPSVDSGLDHYRKTPEFAKLVMWSIQEEATLVSNFQVGRLDSFQMSFDSKPTLDEMVDTRYMAVANGASEHLGLWGN